MYPSHSGGYPAPAGRYPSHSGGYLAPAGRYPSHSGGYPAPAGRYPSHSGGYLPTGAVYRSGSRKSGKIAPGTRIPAQNTLRQACLEGTPRAQLRKIPSDQPTRCRNTQHLAADPPRTPRRIGLFLIAVPTLTQQAMEGRQSAIIQSQASQTPPTKTTGAPIYQPTPMSEFPCKLRWTIHFGQRPILIPASHLQHQICIMAPKAPKAPKEPKAPNNSNSITEVAEADMPALHERTRKANMWYPSIQVISAAPPANIVSATRCQESGEGEPADKCRQVFEWTNNHFIDLIRFVGRLYKKHHELVDSKD
ncbi:hypothetical protein PCASD_06534 [Puccinia coronata f. sp. avenae]|uniref:Uncharacterized protein n=1 Tax=Puccinia coronata f. sp. avenae TaxID=200324 RepID=A0A2N5TFV6_9BASI|nr:hypothetical protein PCASD_06534 [Puccinia coronata f. sp. avenae]